MISYFGKDHQIKKNQSHDSISTQFNDMNTSTDKIPQSVASLKQFWEKKAISLKPMGWVKKSQSPINAEILCEVKTASVDNAMIHEIELHCKCCSSSFIVRAAHECLSTVTDESGLEWFRESHNQIETINLKI
ncbi:hypothetical protein BC833DRAFT_621696 [Globomyces pollinis-pini]|nr:hypothetical protein BC833DRAFT_621696 [Globomyces pollinis-pini]